VLIYLIVLILLNQNSYALPSYKNITLNQFVERVSIANNMNIFIDEDLTKQNISFYVPTIKKSKTLFEAFKIAIDKKGLRLVKKGNFYYLSKKLKYKIHNYLIKLSYNCSKDFDKYLQLMTYKYTYFKSDNSYIVKCNLIQKKQLDIFLKSLDVQAKQVMLKFYILSYDSKKIKERGIKFGTVYKALDSTTKTAINALVFPLSTSKNILSSTSFYSALYFLNTNNDIQIKQFPYVLVKNNNSFKFESVQNIPYLVKNTKTDSNTVQDNNSYEYKDVGLKIHGIASIYKQFVTLKLDLTIEDIINTSGDKITPSTNKRYLNSITNLKYGQVLILSGVKQSKKENTHLVVPFLSNIPYLGKVFTYDYTSDTSSNISVAIQVQKQGVGADVLSPTFCERSSQKVGAGR